MIVVKPLLLADFAGGRCPPARAARRRIAGEDSAPARQATNTWRLGGTPVSGMITTPGRRCGVREPRHERDPEPAGDEPHHRLPVARPVRDLRAEAGGAAAGDEDLVAGPADRRRDPALVGELGEIDPGARGQGVIDGSTASSASPSSSSRWKRVSSRRGACEHSMPRIRSTSRATSIATASGVSASWIRSVTAGATARSGRAAGASRPASAVGKPPIRTSPRGAESCAARSPFELLELGEQGVGVPEQHVRGGRQPHAAPGGFQQPVPELAFQRGELLGHRGGREMQRVGRRRERPVIGDRA